MNMLINCHVQDGENILYAQDNAKRANHGVKVMRRVVKHRENAAWRAELTNEQDDTQACEAYEDREAILNHISDMHYHGVHLRSMTAFVKSLHHPEKFGGVTTLIVLEACGAIAA